MKQASLFGDEGPVFTNRKVAAVTFQGKLKRPIHRWYRLTPSFSPDLADDVAEHFGLGGGDLVLDPFGGVGTVPLCMKDRGVPACGVELNPYLRFVATVKTRDYPDPGAVETRFADFLRRYRADAALLPSEEEAEGWLRVNDELVPRIKNPERWWSPGNLMQLACLRRAVASFEAPPESLDLIKMGILGVLIPVSNAKHNHVSLTFADRPLPMVDLADVLSEKFDAMADDLRAVAGRPRSDVTIHAGNSKELSKVLPSSARPTAVITSPPYPNRFSYARETRPHLFFFDFIKDARAVGEMETAAIGGTWGRATSVLAAGVAPANETVAELLAPHVRDIDGSGPLMASYVTKYFNDIHTHAGEVARVCADDARLAYVIGNSKFYGHPLPSDEILAGIFARFGFELEGIERMRRRQSKQGLHEAVVFMRRGAIDRAPRNPPSKNPAEPA